MVTQLQPDVRAYLHGGEVIKRYIRVEEVAHECTKIYSWSRGFDQDLTNFWHSQKKISTG